MLLNLYKKNKDSTTNYIRKIYGNNAKYIDIVIARIREVIYYISGFDIDLYTFLSFNYSKEMCDFLYSNIAPMGNIFKDEFCKVVDNPAILTEIRIKLQSILTQELETQNQQQKEDNLDNANEEINDLY